MPDTRNNLRLLQTDELLRPWRSVRERAAPRSGWLRTVREALGMTTGQLAARVGVTQQAIAEFEKNEARGKIMLESLDKLALALGCRLVYAVVPDKPLAEIRRDRALALADALQKSAGHSMKLEAQRVSEHEAKRQRKWLAEALLRDSPRKLWR